MAYHIVKTDTPWKHITIRDEYVNNARLLPRNIVFSESILHSKILIVTGNFQISARYLSSTSPTRPQWGRCALMFGQLKGNVATKNGRFGRRYAPGRMKRVTLKKTITPIMRYGVKNHTTHLALRTSLESGTELFSRQKIRSVGNGNNVAEKVTDTLSRTSCHGEAEVWRIDTGSSCLPYGKVVRKDWRWTIRRV